MKKQTLILLLFIFAIISVSATHIFNNDCYQAKIGGNLELNAQNKKLLKAYFLLTEPNWKTSFNGFKASPQIESKTEKNGKKEFILTEKDKELGLVYTSAVNCQKDKLEYNFNYKFEKEFKGRIIFRIELNPEEFIGMPLEFSNGKTSAKEKLPSVFPFEKAGAKKDIENLSIKSKSGNNIFIELPKKSSDISSSFNWKGKYLTLILYCNGKDGNLEFPAGKIGNLSFKISFGNKNGLKKEKAQNHGAKDGIIDSSEFLMPANVVNKGMYDGVKTACWIFKGEEMSSYFDVKNPNEDLCLEFRGVNGDHLALPLIEILVNGKPLIKSQTPFARDKLDNKDDEWRTFKIHAPSKILKKKDNLLTIKNHGPDWWMIDFAKYSTSPDQRKGNDKIARKTNLTAGVDGKLDESCWKNARPISLDSKTENAAYIIYDDRNFYIRIKTQQDSAGASIALTPCNKDENAIYCFSTDQSGNKSDSKIADGKELESWNGAWDCVRNIDNKNCIYEFQIPFSMMNISSPFGILNDKNSSFYGGAKKWKIKIAAEDKKLSPESLKDLEMQEISLENDFPQKLHEPLKILDIGNAAQNINRARVMIKNWGQKDKKLFLRLSAEKLPKEKAITKTIEIKGKSELETEIDYPVLTESGKYKLKLGLYEPKEKIVQEMFFEIDAPDTLELRPDKSYYTSEKTARLKISKCFGPLSIKDLNGKIIIYKTEKKKEIKEEINIKFKSNSHICKINPQNYKPGIYPIAFRLYSNDGNVLSKTESRIIKKEKGVNEVKYDWNNNILFNDKFFFPIGFWNVPLEKLSFIGECGFNSVVLSVGMPHSYLAPNKTFKKINKENISLVKEYMDEAHKHGIKVIVNLGAILYKNGTEKTPLEKINFGDVWNLVNELKTHPALLCWYPIDEPSYRNISLKYVKKLYAGIKKLDQYHPVFLSDSSAYHDVSKKYYDEAEILGRHNYPIPGSVKVISEHFDKLISMNGNNKPVLFTPQSFYYCWVKIEDTGNRNRVPTVRETKAMAYIALSRNAKGLLWFPYRQWHHPTQMVKFSLKKGGFYNLDELYFDLWDGIESLCKDLKTLFPALSSETIPCDIQTNSLDICTFMRKSKGDYYFFATNTSPNQIKVRFNSPSYGAPEVIFENRSINKNKSGFEDSFFPHETHIYRLKKNKD